MNVFSQLFGTGGSSVSAIDAAQAHARLRKEGAPYLLDVREPAEYREGHIAGALLIPLGELPTCLAELPRDREILCVCASGSRSGHAARLLASQGLQVVNLHGGMIGWLRAGFPIRQGMSK